MSTSGSDRTTMQLKQALGDADALIALLNKDDQNNAAALAASSMLDASEASVFFLDSTIAEAATAFKRRLNSPQHAQLLIDYCKQGIIHVRHGDDAIMQRAYNYFDPYSSKQHTFFDYLVAAAAKELAVDAIFSFDELYHKLGFKTVADFVDLR